MANNYTPPSTIDFFGVSFNSGVIYYNAQDAYAESTTTSEEEFTYTSISGSYAAETINVPVAGSYLISTGIQVSAGANNINVGTGLVFSQAGQSNITFGQDSSTLIPCVNSGFFYPGFFTREVTFPTPGNWSVIPTWCAVHVDSSAQLNEGTPWFLMLHGVDPMNAVNQQLTQFVNSSYTLMTNVDAGAWWGTLTNATVAGYQTSITSNTSAISAQSSTISLLSNDISGLQTDVSDINSDLSNLTRLSTFSGGLNFKP